MALEKVMQTSSTDTAQEPAASKAPNWLVVVAAGCGGPQALAQMFPRFPANFPGTIIIIQHMRPGFTRVLADQLNHICQLPVHEASDGEALQAGRILVIPTATGLTIEPIASASGRPHVIFLDSTKKPAEQAGCVDNIMKCAVGLSGKKTIGVLLTGLGSDGCEGLRAISQAGGMALVQDENTSIVHDLPASAISAGVAHEVFPLWSIADRIMEIVTGDANAIAA
jgi:two-component system chemotaxis response regulator CheB